MVFFKKSYSSVILDMDGVVFDSNNLKARNIYSAVLSCCSPQIATDFTTLFTGLNGVPREEKIFNYFQDKQVASDILNAYNNLNAKSLNEVSFTDGFLPFLRRISLSNTPAYILSGGDESEVTNLLESKGIYHLFKKVMGGPVDKKTNLKALDNLAEPVIYFGDSQTDYETALAFGFDFVFMYGYSQFGNWKEFFSERKICAAIQNFKFIGDD